MSILRAIKTLIGLDWEKILAQYSLGALIFEVGLLPFWFFSTGSVYFQIRSLLGCNSLFCYKLAMLISLIPSTLLSAKLSALSRSYLFPTGYNIIDDESIVTPVGLSNSRTLRVYIFAVALSVSSVSVLNKAFPNSKYTYFTRTLKPRVKNRIRNMKFKVKKKVSNIHKKFKS